MKEKQIVLGSREELGTFRLVYTDRNKTLDMQCFIFNPYTDKISGVHTFLKFDPRDLSKNVKKLFKKGVSPHLREFEGRGPLLQS